MSTANTASPKGGAVPVCGGEDAGKEPKRRSVYEDRPVVEVVDEEWRAEQLRSIGLPYRLAPARRVPAGPPMTDVDRFARFFAMLGYELEPFQREIVAECFSPRRETLVLIPRANGKSTLLAGLAVWELLKRPNAQIVVGAASREQASVLFDIAREMAAHPEVAPLVEITRREIRTQAGWLKVIAADGPRQHGLIVDLAIVDELHAHRHDELYIALRTALQKRQRARGW